MGDRGTRRARAARLAAGALVLVVGLTGLASLGGTSGAEEPEPATPSTTSTSTTSTTTPPATTTSTTAPPTAGAAGEVSGPVEAGPSGPVAAAGGGDVSGAGAELSTSTLLIPEGAAYPYGQPFSMTAVVVNNSGVPRSRPTGNLTVWRSADDGGTWEVAASGDLIDTTVPDPDDPFPSGYLFFNQIADLVPGTYDYYASYDGEPEDPDPYVDHFAPSASLQVNGGAGIVIDHASTTSLSPPFGTFELGEDVVVTATVESRPAGGPTPTGSVSFSRDDVFIGTGALVGGQATFTDVGRPAGTYTYEAEYVVPGHPQSTSVGVAHITVGGGEALETTVLGILNAPTFPYGRSPEIIWIVTNTWGVPNPRPTGELRIFRTADGGSTWELVETATLGDNLYPFPTDSPAGYVYFEDDPFLPPGQYGYYAEYVGEPVPDDPLLNWFAPATSLELNSGNGLEVTAGSLISLVPRDDEIFVGDAAVFDVTMQSAPVPPSSLSGDVYLYRNGEQVDVQPLLDGAGVVTDLSPPFGNQAYTATFVPDSEAELAYLSSTDEVVVSVRNTATPEVLLSVDQTVAPEGSTFRLTADVSYDGVPITDGEVVFSNAQGQWIAQVPAANPILDVVPPIGYHRYTARYLGVPLEGLQPADSEQVDITVTGELPSDVVVTTEGSPTTYGEDFVVEAEVLDLGVLPTGSRDPASGTVTFYDAAVGALGEARLEAVGDSMVPTATLVVTRDLPPGERDIWAVYGGEQSDPSGFPYEPSESPSTEHVVQQGAVQLTLTTASAPLPGITGGACLSLLAVVTPTVGSAPVDGTVTYTVDGEEGAPPTAGPRCPTLIPDGTTGPAGTISGAWASPPTPVGTPFTTWLADGDHQLGASFDGDSGYAAATTNLVQTIGQPVDPNEPPDPNGPGGPSPTPPDPTGPVGDPGPTGTEDPVASSVEDRSAPDAALARVLPAVAGAAGLTGVDAEAGDEAAEGAAPDVASKDDRSTSSRFEVQQSLLADSIPTSQDVDWGLRSVVGALWLALLLIVLVEVPSTLVNATFEDHHDRITAPFQRPIAATARVDAVLAGWPNLAVLGAFAVVGGLIAAQLEPGLGLDASSLVLVVALICTYALITSVVELLRLPFLRARTGQGGHLKLFPLVLLGSMAVVAISRVVGFQPGYVFGLSVALLLAPGIEEEDEGRSLFLAGGALLGVALAAWFVWQPIADQVADGDTALVTIFLDALLSTTWVMSLQIVLFQFSSLRGMHGRTMRRWSKPAWWAIYGTGAFLLMKMVLHPSAWRWGGLSTGTFVGMIAVFAALLLGALGFWAWFNLRPSPDDETPDDLDDDVDVHAERVS